MDYRHGYENKKEKKSNRNKNEKERRKGSGLNGSKAWEFVN